MNSERRALWIRIVAESALIVFSLLLALWIDGAREQRALDARRAQALEHIHRELSANLASIRAVEPYHDSVIAAANELLAGSEWEGKPVMAVAPRMAPRGLSPPSLQSTAWDAAIAAEAVPLFDFGTASLVAAVYGWQEQGVDRTVQRVADRVFSPASFEPAATRSQVLLLQALMQEMRAQERSLAAQYERVLQHLAEVRGGLDDTASPEGEPTGQGGRDDG